ncbi:hypothetical protein IAR55_007189 [Kwoniella newhampshirensis]|uniref:3-oxoacyl-[acyl-carrier protein] reductase n=1 Tax=Kwoniella newhampshirensis TaxID=1651941 RepID=A0AAW0YDT6_9TREE
MAAKVAMITGGTKGIGRATAVHLASLGFDLALVYSSSSQDFDATKSEVQGVRAGAKVLEVKADLTKSESNKSAVDKVVREFGKIDALILNAAIMPMKPFAACTEEDLDKIHALNYKSPFLMTQAAVPFIPKGGRIIFLSTTLNTNSSITEPYVLYCPTKGAIEQLARILAKSLGGEKGIRVNTVAPGPTATELFLKGKPDELVARIASANPFNRLGSPEEIAQAIGFLSGPSSAWVSGQILRVNGAMVV